MPVLRRRLARADDALRRHGVDRRQRLGDVRRLARRRHQSDAGDDLHPVARARARRAHAAARDDHAGRLARARADVQGPAAEARRSRPVELRLPRLPGDAGRRHPDLPREHGPGRRGPGRRTSSSSASSRAASTTSTAASPGFEDKAKAAIKKLGAKKARRYGELRTAFQEQGDDGGARSREGAARRDAEPVARRPRAAVRLSRGDAPRDPARAASRC